MVEIRTSFYSGPGLMLSAILRVPDDYKKGEKRGAVVLCGGYASFRDMTPLPTVANSLTEAGYVTLNFDYRGFASSEGPRWRIIPEEQVEDIRNGITFLQTREEVDPEKIGLWGTSLGGGLVVYVAAVDERVKCSIVTVPAYSGIDSLRTGKTKDYHDKFMKEIYENRKLRVTTGRSKRVDPFTIYEPNPSDEAIKFWKETRAQFVERRDMRVDFEYFEKQLEFAPVDVANKVKTPIMFTYAGKDSLAPGAQLMFDRANGPKEVNKFNVGHHEIYEPHTLAEVMKLHLSWYTKWMPPR